jgi:hypothetical protein
MEIICGPLDYGAGKTEETNQGYKLYQKHYRTHMWLVMLNLIDA